MLLSICMIVKDEEKNLERCLNSLLPLLNSLESELIIVDTGSKDKTVEIAKRYTDKVFFHEWNEDFSEARNKSISYAKGQWIMIIDADEELESYNEIIDFFKSDQKDKYNTVSIKVKNILELKAGASSIVSSERLFRNDGTFRYVGIVHNMPASKEPKKYLNSLLIHYGYINSDTELMEKKFERTSNLIKKILEKEPENIYYLYQLSCTYFMHKDYKEALDEALKAFNALKKLKIQNNINYIFIYNQLAKSLIINNKYEHAKTICLEALKICREHIDFYFYLGLISSMLNEIQNAVHYYLKYLELVKDYNNLSISKIESIEIFTLEKKDEAHMNLGKLYFMQQEYDKAIFYVKQVKNKNFLFDSLLLLLRSHLNNNNFDEIYNIYKEYKNENEVYEFIKSNIEEIINNLKNKGNLINLLSIFINDADYDDPYSLLMKARYYYFNNNYFELDKVILEFTNKFYFNNLEVFYGDIIYFMIIRKNTLLEIIQETYENRLSNLFEYIFKKYGIEAQNNLLDFIKNMNSNVSNDNIKNDLSKYKLVKIILRMLLMIDDKYFSQYFYSYVNAGIEYIKIVYSTNLINNELIFETKHEEDSFFIYIMKALMNKNNIKSYIYYLRKALHVYPLMAKGVKMLLDDIK